MKKVFEYIAENKDKQLSWKDLANEESISKIFDQEYWKDYIIPWSLAHLLMKI